MTKKIITLRAFAFAGLAGNACSAPTRYNSTMALPILAPRLAPERIRLARLIALTADFIQVVAFPLFAMGAASPLNDLLDLLTAAVMTFLLGWHWAFLPAFLAEGIPIFDLFPTWTAAVYYVTRGQLREPPDRADAAS